MPTSPDELVTYLRLTPEFGGTRFGPFEGVEVRLGSDPDRCHIVLPEALGVRAEHVKLIRQGPQNLILTPSERTATVFLYKTGAHRPVQLNTPTAVRPGDSFTVVTADGPRFVIELDELPPEIKARREESRRVATGRRRLSAESMGQEVKRQAWTKLLVMGPMQMAQRVALYIKSGAIYQPRNIILFATIASGWILGGVSTCRISGFKKQLQQQEVKVESCEQELAFAQNMTGDSTEYKLEQLAQEITSARGLGPGLEEDDALRDAWKKSLRLVFDQRESYKWITNEKSPKAARFADWRERALAEEDIDPDTGRLLVWLAASPGRRTSEYTELTDSESVDVCGAGPLGMTFRQAVRLGIPAQADALVTRNFEEVYESKEQTRALLSATLEAAGLPPLQDGEEIEVGHEQVAQGRAYCLYVEGQDDRKNPRRTLRALARQLGPDSDLLPQVGTIHASTARIAKYWAADITRVDYREKDPGITFESAPPGAVLSSLEARGAWALKRTADTLARAVALPCIAVLSGDAKTADTILGEGNSPSAINCLVLDCRLRNEG
ncbi:MAG: hypothetical protein D6798_15995 [Deltaproteobacteria bacterium]|nr:MAG: hypothetical protein D6798_15995 [Deltaproteobacteria bacterium]